MYCNNCGHANDASSGYCVFCGAPLSMYSQPSPPPHPGFVPNYSAYPAINPVYTEFLRLGRNPALLTAIIAYTVYVVFSILSSVLDVVMYNHAFTVFNFTYFLGDAINIFFLVGMWKTFADVRRPHDGVVKTSGFNMLRVCSIIRVVFFCVMFIGVFVFLVYIGSFEAENPSFMSAPNGEDMVLVFSLILFLSVFGIPMIAAILMYYILLIRSIRTVTYTVNTGYASAKVSTYVIVMSFVMAGLIPMVNMFYLEDFISMTAFAVSLISFGIFLNSYKKTMRALVYAGLGDPSENPVYYHPQYYGQPPYNGYYQ